MRLLHAWPQAPEEVATVSSPCPRGGTGAAHVMRQSEPSAAAPAARSSRAAVTPEFCFRTRKLLPHRSLGTVHILLVFILLTKNDRQPSAHRQLPIARCGALVDLAIAEKEPQLE